MLCSHAITLIPATESVAFHFCDFAQPFEPLQVLSMLARQMLSSFGKHFDHIPDKMAHVAHSSASSLNNVQELISLMIKRLPRVFIFFDGLDEETPTTATRWRDTMIVLDFLFKLAAASPDKVRLWCSSQYKDEICKVMTEVPAIDITSHAREDVKLYLSQSITNIDILEEVDQATFLGKTQQRADWCFLYAYHMVSALQNECNSLGEMEDFIDEGFPDDLAGYYRNIFKRFRKPLRSLAW